MIDFVAAVFAGNIMTLSFVWGMSRIDKFKPGEESEVPWLVYAALLLPLTFMILVLIANGWTPPILDAVAVR